MCGGSDRGSARGGRSVEGQIETQEREVGVWRVGVCRVGEWRVGVWRVR